MKYKLLIILILLTVMQVSADDDALEGDLELSGNYPVHIEAYFDTESIVPVTLAIEVYIEAFDNDNSSSELFGNVTYTLDGENFTTVALVETDDYYYEYTFPAPLVDQYIQYFYNISDGITTLRSPLTEGTYYDIQWGEIVIPTTTTKGDGPSYSEDVLGDITDAELVVENLTTYFLIAIGLLLIAIIDRLTHRKIISAPILKVFKIGKKKTATGFHKKKRGLKIAYGRKKK